MQIDTSYIDFDDVLFIDCETRSAPGQEDERWADLTQTAVHRYAENAWPIVITYAHGITGEIKRWASSDVTRRPRRDELPLDLLEWDGYFAAYNSGFDRVMLGHLLNAPTTAWLDMMAQAAVSGLPAGLDRAAKACGHTGKVQLGKKLIEQFCSPDGDTPDSHPEDWEAFLEYADVDIEAMQAIAASTLPLPMWQWEEFWASETINDRGLPVDTAMLRGGAILADQYLAQTNERVEEITNGAMTTVKQYIRQRAWVWERVRGNPLVAQTMIHAQRKHPETGEDEYIFKLDRPVITKMLAALNTLNETDGLTDEEYDVMRFLEEREFGASATPQKFAKALTATTSWGRLTNQYTFNGAQQTGRFSSRGVQMHNLTNQPVGSYDDECDLAEIMVQVGAYGGGYTLEDIEKRFGNVGRALARMIRPAITAPDGKELVWGDWSNIEARVLPWLAHAEERLDIFREIDGDPASPDVYIRSAAGMYNSSAAALWTAYRDGDKEAKALRQRGKIAELALGFGGGKGALQSMASNYGMAFEDTEATEIVQRWRAANTWAKDFWENLWHSFNCAVNNPGTVYHAGRISYEAFGYMGGLCVVAYLPDSRPIFYRSVTSREFVEYDPFEPAVEIGRTQSLGFSGPEGFKRLWMGLLAENVTQATAASALRWTLVSLQKEDYWLPVVGHTHDEIITLPDGEYTDAAIDTLRYHMVQDYGWNTGLPTAADVTHNVCYTKALEQ